MVTQIHPYILESDFNIPSILKDNVPSLIEGYKSNQEKYYSEERKGYDTPIFNNEISNPIISQITEIILKEFITDYNFIMDTGALLGSLRLYIQDNKFYKSEYHNHISSPGNICSVFYLNIPKEGGELSFSSSKFKEEIIIKPRENKIYFFPKWLDHKPLPQEDPTPRLCFNWDYPGNTRPIVKYTKANW